MNTGYAILVKVVRLDQSYSFLLPFQTSTWLLLLAALLAVVLVLSLLDNFTRAARYRALEEHHGVERVLRKRRRERAMEHASESIFMLVGQVRPAAGGGGGRQCWNTTPGIRRGCARQQSAATVGNTAAA
jgi:hypothetical protein